jgi:hypothetical protein
MKIAEREKSVLISEGDVRLKVHFLQSGELSFNQVTGFNPPPEVRGESTPDYKNNWHLTASTATKESKARYITLLVPYKKGKEPYISADNLVENEEEVSVDLNIEGKRFHVSFLPEVNVKEISSR